MVPSAGGRRETPEVKTEDHQRRFLAELRDAVSVRTVLLVSGVLLLQLGFILSYVGAFHAPHPYRIPIGVVAPAPVAAKVSAELNGIASQPLHASSVDSVATARREIENGTLSAALVVDSASKTDRLLVASAGGASIVTAVEEIITDAEASLHRHAVVEDVVPLQPGDGHGLTGFYLVIGWIVGGYLVAALLEISGGASRATLRRAIIRLLAVVPYAILSGLGGAVIVGPVLGALTGHLVALWWLGTLLVLSAAAVTMAFQALFGVIGIGITVLLFVVLGNPSAGARTRPHCSLRSGRALRGVLPNGAGVDAVRRIVYFGAHGIGGDLAVIVLYIVAGVLITLIAAWRRDQRDAERQRHAAPAEA